MFNLLLLIYSFLTDLILFILGYLECSEGKEEVVCCESTSELCLVQGIEDYDVDGLDISDTYHGHCLH